ncbi:hypothetical protein NZD85_14645 (plasmid) [Empedobacter stercoris]|uniref:hypothetical protein n=1 Tax=Empedobacter stercoris TaxID=1628248 RepID=UPI0021B0286F|nr:hypothetical protein [Empedobacter stercoris]UWX68461.1 hypothetical protein NZD85_14645 [Empedobacter stercoris]
MKIKNLLLFAIFSLLFSCTNRQLINTLNNDKISFRWESFDFEGKNYKYGAMYVPVKIPTIDKEFEMQFDLGMNVNIAYENPLNTIIAQYPKLKNNYFKRSDYEIFYTNLFLDNLKSSVDSLFVYKDFGSNEPFEKLKKIGTIGVNEIENKVLIIDYPKQTLQIAENSKSISSTDYVFTPIEIFNGKIKINLNIDGQDYAFLFDTGAGLVPATTIDSLLYKEITTNETKNQDTITANSWGEATTLIGNKIIKRIKVNNYPLEIESKKFYYTNSEKHQKFFKDLDLFGSIGNEFFISDIIVIDLERKLFGIKKK